MKSIYSKIEKVEEHYLYFYIIEISDPRQESNNVLEFLKNRTWLGEINDKTLIKSYKLRADKTSLYFEEKINKELKATNSDELADIPDKEFENFLSFIGEKIVTINANKTIEDELNYRALPLPELWKMKKDGNPGFDYFNENTIKYYLIYGEGKFVSGDIPYNRAAKQVRDFINSGHDEEEKPEVKEFIDEKTKNNSYKEYSIAFSIPGKNTDTYDDIYEKTKNNKHISELLKSFDIYAVGVKI